MAKGEADVQISKEQLKTEVLADYRLANLSRETSLLGRKEVLTGKAKFGIFGDGKEIAQIALAKQFQVGDFRSGYYRDQTIMMAAGLLSVQEFFGQLYAHTDAEADPSSAGRQMNGHYATRNLNEDGSWKDLMAQKNSSADVSPTASQMPRLLGLAYASKFYRNNPELKDHQAGFSNKGNEIAFGTIGDASTSEGIFWETINAAGVLQVPMVMSVWDDGHGISVEKKHQTTKESISTILAGFEKEKGTNGFKIFKTKGWDYANLILTYEKAAEAARVDHIPVLVHVEEVTQPQGHSTSGSHERYKSEERLQWEKEFDPILKMKEWILEKALATSEELEAIEKETKEEVKLAKKAAWTAYTSSMSSEYQEVLAMLERLSTESGNTAIGSLHQELKLAMDPMRKDIVSAARKALRYVAKEELSSKTELLNWYTASKAGNQDRFNSYLYSESAEAALSVEPKAAAYQDSKRVDGREILRDNFATILDNDPRVIIFGEDSGRIGGVNQGLEGLQDRFGEHRVFDTGIREATIIGQGIGMAMRGLRPIAEIQYLDYLLYALQIMSDDLATVQYRTKGGQKAPLIIRTRGHRLEGIWHSGSPMGMIINACRGIHVCVPRNMTQAAGFYNTLLKSDEPGLVIESLNGYRLKEDMPSNLGEFRVPLGIPEVMKEGSDISLVTYGSMVRMAEQAATQLEEFGISAEVIDVQTLLPFDINHSIKDSLAKTSRVVFIDEDVPGGASAFMMQKVLEEQGAYYLLDSEPRTLSSKEHRPAYGSDGDYFSKPSLEDIFDAAYGIMHESDPEAYPRIY